MRAWLREFLIEWHLYYMGLIVGLALGYLWGRS